MEINILQAIILHDVLTKQLKEEEQFPEGLDMDVKEIKDMLQQLEGKYPVLKERKEKIA